MVKSIEIKLEKDLRESNISQRDLEGNPIKFKQSEFVCKVLFDNGTFWLPEFLDISKILKLIADNEEFKYKDGILGRNMPFYEIIFPIWEEELLKHGFNPEEGLLKLIKIKEMQDAKNK